ncbi:MAG: NAD(+)/NADH kinase [Firmicutes bacterium]|jgi:NAD+ kinase|nr:NAD(+)/NADH kinase [Bacillota bacterium]
MDHKRIFIYHNNTYITAETVSKIAADLSAKGFKIVPQFDPDVDFIICVGGDGTLLRLLPDLGYPSVPIVGVNTGHVGFFQEFETDGLDALADILAEKRFDVQRHRLIQATVFVDGKTAGVHKAINDVTIRNNISRLSHFSVSIGGTFIERFSGDGLVVSTPVGSTAYNYSLGGAIVDPRLNLLQVSPIAPMNAVAFRSFTSSLLLPPDLDVWVNPDAAFEKTAILALDGFEFTYENVSEIRVNLAKEEVSIVRSEGFDFWAKVTSKFL